MAKTLSNPENRAEIIHRIGLLSPESQRQWGTMTVDAMICHLYDAYQVAIGEKIAQPVKMPLPQRVMKAFALRSPGQWPHGLPTPDEVKQGIGGTPACEFAADRRRLLAALDRFFVCETLASIAHPYFGTMREEDWMRWGYLHADHHLRQFSV